MAMKKVSVIEEGTAHDVLIDPAVTNDPSEGLPLSVRFEALGLPELVLKRLYAELRARGLVEPTDFLHSDALSKITLALMHAYQVDAQIIQKIAYQQKVK
jgi:hypothetical protein